MHTSILDKIIVKYTQEIGKTVIDYLNFRWLDLQAHQVNLEWTVDRDPQESLVPGVHGASVAYLGDLV